MFLPCVWKLSCYVEVIDLSCPSDRQGAPKLTYDPEWMAITRAFQPWLSTTHKQRAFPDEGTARRMVSAELEWVMGTVGDGYEIGACQEFGQSAPGWDGRAEGRVGQGRMYGNGQTAALCGLLGIENRVAEPLVAEAERGSRDSGTI